MRRRKLLIAGGVGIGIWLIGRKPAMAVVGPLTREGSQASSVPVEPTPAGYLSRAYDAVFRAECSGIPVEYLRALAHQESRINPKETKGACWGLLQVCPNVLKSYNERFGTSWSMGTDMLQADRNARVACELIRRIPGFYISQHPGAFPGGFSWSSRRHVDLLTMGWNAGWSESRGVAGAIGKLLGMGRSAEQITVQAVRDASAAGLFPSTFTDKLSRQDVVDWVKKVSRYYVHELRAPAV